MVSTKDSALRSQSSFFNFYYCRSYCKISRFFVVNPLSLISTIVDPSTCRTSLTVNPLSLISTIVDQTISTSAKDVNPLSLISTIVDVHARRFPVTRQSSFFNFYYCRSRLPSWRPRLSILFL